MKKLFFAFMLIAPLATSAADGKSGRKPSNTDTLVVRACDKETPPDSEDYAVAMRSFSNGSVKFVHVDTEGEPVCCSSHLLVFVKNKNSAGERCFHIASTQQGLGFNYIDLARGKSSYDSQTGLSVIFPFSFYQETGDSRRVEYKVLVNQKTPSVTVTRN